MPRDRSAGKRPKIAYGIPLPEEFERMTFAIGRLDIFKLMLLIGLMSTITIIVAALGITRLTAMNTSLAQVDDVGNWQLLGARMNQNLIIINRSEYRIAADPSAETVAAATEVNLANRKTFEDRFKQVRAAADPAEAAQLDQIKDIYESYLRGSDKIIELARNDSGKIVLSDEQKALSAKVKETRTLADKLQAAIKSY
eukprot:gene23953-25567_t